MFRDIRKKKNQISRAAAEQLLREARRGILAVNGREGYPYAIPINYYYDREAQKIYFHGARAGHKAEAIRACGKVCFTVYGGETIREEAWAPYLRSVVVFGRAGPAGAAGGQALRHRLYPADLSLHRSRSWHPPCRLCSL